jgi:hypothetical protein
LIFFPLFLPFTIALVLIGIGVDEGPAGVGRAGWMGSGVLVLVGCLLVGYRTRVDADREGIEVVSPIRTRQVTWGEVASFGYRPVVRIPSRRRYGAAFESDQVAETMDPWRRPDRTVDFRATPYWEKPYVRLTDGDLISLWPASGSAERVEPMLADLSARQHAWHRQHDAKGKSDA